MTNPVEFAKAKLSSKQRGDLPKGDFVFPDKAPGSGSYPIPDRSHAANALARASGKPEEAAVKAAVYRKYPDLKPDAKKSEHIEKATTLLVDEAQHVVYGVVLSPGVEDSQGDIIDADQIEKAAHQWLVEFRKHDVQHTEVAKGDDGLPIAEPVESYIAPCDLEIAGEPVLKGAWVVGTRINDPGTWDDVVSGRRTGFSIGGSGVRQPITD